MGYLYLVIVAALFSLGGTSVKMIRPFFPPAMITFFRFFVGVGWLLLLKAGKRQRFRADFPSAFRKQWKWLIFGAVSKTIAYSLENIGLSIGVSYGNILTQPAQMMLLTAIGAIVLHEAMNRWNWLGVGCCIAGILMISWNGMSLEAFWNENLFLSLLYVFSGFGAGLFVFAQKKVAEDFDILDSNLTMFAMASVLSLPIPLAQGSFLPFETPDWKCIVAILYFGFVTGIGFYLNAKAIPLVPFQMVALLQSTMVFFSLTWGVLFFQEPLTGWILGGTLLFVAGIVLMNYRAVRVECTEDEGNC